VEAWIVDETGWLKQGRFWRGFHHHLVLAAIAYLFILTRYLGSKKSSGLALGEDPGSDPAVAAEVDRIVSLLPGDLPGPN
jgi:hypothetical protein